jgi:DNA-binding response OmpR family regulator
MDKVYRILLIDDNPGDARLTKEVLKECNLNSKVLIDIISDSEEAELFILRQSPFEESPWPDIIILDLNLPKKNGHELLKIIKSNASTKTTPVIIMTTSDADYDRKNAYDNLANAYVVKPPDFESLITTMRNIVNFWFDTVLLPNKDI